MAADTKCTLNPTAFGAAAAAATASASTSATAADGKQQPVQQRAGGGAVAATPPIPTTSALRVLKEFARLALEPAMYLTRDVLPAPVAPELLPTTWDAVGTAAGQKALYITLLRWLCDNPDVADGVSGVGVDSDASEPREWWPSGPPDERPVPEYHTPQQKFVFVSVNLKVLLPVVLAPLPMGLDLLMQPERRTAAGVMQATDKDTGLLRLRVGAQRVMHLC